MRIGQTSPDDPMRNYWQDQLYQTQFSIAEQKANLHYTREHNAVAGDRYMVDFYKQWAQKLPRASAAWRDMMTSAAKFAKAARAASSAGAASSRYANLKAAVDNIQKNRIDPAFATMSVLYNVAVDRAGMARATSGDLLNAFDFTATQLGGQAPQSGVGGVQSFTQILDGIMAQPDWPSLRHSLRQHGGAQWDGVLNHEHVLSMLEGLRKGTLRQAQLYANYGDTATARTLRDRAAGYASSMAHFRSIFSGTYEQYNTLHDNFHASLQASNSPYETVSLASKYAGDLLKLAGQAEARGDFSLAGQLRIEANAANGQTPGGSATIGENTQGGKATNQATDVNATAPTANQTDANKLTGGVVGALAPTGQAQTEAQALAFAMQTAQYEAKGLADGSLVMTIDKNNQMQIVSRATMQAIGNGNPVITTGVPTAGATFTGADGKVTQLPGAILPQAIGLVPIYVTVPKDVTNPDSQLAPGTNTSNLPTVEDPAGNPTSKFAGYYVPFGNGVVGYAHPTGTLGPDGQPELVWSGIPPYVNTPGAIHAEGLQNDGTYRVEYSPQWLAGQVADGPLGAVLSTVYKTDSKGNPVLDLQGHQVTQSFFNPTPLLNPGVTSDGQYLFGALGPQFGVPPVAAPGTPGATPTPAATPDTGTINQTPTGGQPAPGATQAQWDQHLTDLWTQSHPNGEAPPPKDSPVWGSFAAANGLPTTPPDIATLPTPPPAQDVSVGDPFGAGGRGVGFIGNKGTAAPPPVIAPAGPTPAEAQATQDAQINAFNQAYYATLSTHPNFLGWGNTTLFLAANTPQTRQAFAALPPEEIIKSMQRDDPLWNDPTHQQNVLGQVDVMRGFGLSGGTEGEFAINRALQGQGGGIFDLGAGIRTLINANSSSSIFAALPQETKSPIIAPDPHRDPFSVQPGTPYQQPVTKLPTAPTLAVVPNIPTPRTGASQAAHQLGAGDIYQVNGRVPGAAAPVIPSGVASLPSIPGVKPSVVNPAPTPKIKNPSLPPPPPPPPPPDVGGGGGTGGRGGKFAV